VTPKITADDCRSCGACCVSGNPTGGDVLDYGYADLTDDDVARMSPRVRSQLQQIFVGGEDRYATRAKQLPTGQYACQHLRGTPGRRCSCSIYDTRPEICRKFRVGGESCRAARFALDCFNHETKRTVSSTSNQKATPIP
jgi:Fe-S-cluster containining protein